MKIRNIVLTVVIGATVTITTACDVNKHMEDVGFKPGSNPVEKGVIKYDTLVDKDEVCNRAWADYESNLQRRDDMIPQLVSVVKASAKHENTTLTNVMKSLK